MTLKRILKKWNVIVWLHLSGPEDCLLIGNFLTTRRSITFPRTCYGDNWPETSEFPKTLSSFFLWWEGPHPPPLYLVIAVPLNWYRLDVLWPIWNLWKVKEFLRQESTEVLSWHVHWFWIGVRHAAYWTGSFVVIERYFQQSLFVSSKVLTVRRNDNWEQVVVIAYPWAVGCQFYKKSFTVIKSLCL
jgi:hypothetical protein